MKLRRICSIVLFLGGAATSWMPATAQFVVPGAADAGRVNPLTEERAAPKPSADIEIPRSDGTQEAPSGTKDVHFILRRVDIRGVTAFSKSELEDIYKPYIGREVTLDIAWLIAGQITERYRAAGYFLSRAYVPQQNIRDGVLAIEVIEGRLGTIDIQGDAKTSSITRTMATELKNERPLKAESLESFLLRLNDMPGYAYRAVLAPDENGRDGLVTLNLIPTVKDGKGSVSVDNYGSRFLGPHQATLSYSTSLLPDQQTTFLGLSSIPTDELNYGGVTHEILIAPKLTLGFSGTYTAAKPGSSLEVLDIESESFLLGTSLRYQWIRQRHENLALKFSFEGRDTDSDIAGTPLVRDRIRALRLNGAYDFAGAQGMTSVNATLSQGVSLLGASDEGDPNLSRAQAKPDFTKAELTATHLMPVADAWQIFGALSGQIASGPLYSAEEFGYGGQFIGRAYDASEITGDHGISGVVELRYSGFGEGSYKFFPYASYDAGIVFNDDAGTPNNASGSSAGLGVRFVADDIATGALALTLPLTRDVSAPLYGMSRDGPRLALQLSRDF